MNEQTAIDLYGGKEKLNCGQAVFKAFQLASKMTDKEIEAFSGIGSGRAEGGVCGALFAVLRSNFITEEMKQAAVRLFEQEAGSAFCKEIRIAHKISCRQCVGLAARMLEKGCRKHAEKRKG